MLKTQGRLPSAQESSDRTLVGTALGEMGVHPVEQVRGSIAACWYKEGARRCMGLPPCVGPHKK